jgi:CBS domain containing-hemolysin-like protein
MMLGIQIVAILALVGANAFFVASEFALPRVHGAEAAALEAEHRRGARPLRVAVEHLEAYVAASRLGSVGATIGLGFLAEPAFERLLGPLSSQAGGTAYAVSFVAAFGLLIMLHVVLGGRLPRSLAIAHSSATALAVAGPLRPFAVAARPAIQGLDRVGSLLLRPFGIPPAREVSPAPPTESELRSMLRESLQEGLIDETDFEIAEGAFAFGDREAHEIMVPRPEIVAVSLRRSAQEALETVVASPHTRYPVYRASLDDIAGIVHVRELFRALYERGLEGLALEPLVRPALLVPETKRLGALLADLRRTRQHVALVVDEYGLVVGLVTLDDLLEEIVGEIEGEYTVHEPVERVGERRLRVDGTFPIEDFNESFGQHLPVEDYHTLGGFVFGVLGREPESGDEVVRDGLCFRVVDVAGRRIERIEVELPKGAERE